MDNKWSQHSAIFVKNGFSPRVRISFSSIEEGAFVAFLVSICVNESLALNFPFLKDNRFLKSL